MGSAAAAYISAVDFAPAFSAILSTSLSAMLLTNPDLYASTSSFKILPLGPEPFTFPRSTPSSRASLRTVGAAITDALLLLLKAEEVGKESSLLLLLLDWAVLLAESSSPAASVWMSTSGAPTLTTSPWEWCTLTIVPAYLCLYEAWRCVGGTG
jgi:hypothetical protein